MTSRFGDNALWRAAGDCGSHEARTQRVRAIQAIIEASLGRGALDDQSHGALAKRAMPDSPVSIDRSEDRPAADVGDRVPVSKRLDRTRLNVTASRYLNRDSVEPWAIGPGPELDAKPMGSHADIVNSQAHQFLRGESARETNQEQRPISGAYRTLVALRTRAGGGRRW